MQTDPINTVACPCCGYETLMAPANYETCPICGWLDAPPDEVTPPEIANRVSLIEAQRNFIAFGACDEDARRYVRSPLVTERRRADWELLAVSLRRQQHDLLDGFAAGKLSLIKLLAQLMDERMLADIASCDYGFNAETNLEALRVLQVGAPLPEPDSWPSAEWLGWANVVEVLKLTSWSAPPLWDSSALGQRRHTQAAFACTVLLSAINESERLTENANHWIIQLIASVLVLGPPLVSAALKLLCQCTLALDVAHPALPFLALGILLLTAAQPDPEPVQLDRLAGWVMQEEPRIRSMNGHSITKPWLLGLTNSNSLHSTWRAVSQRLLLEPTQPWPSTVATLLQEIGLRLQEETLTDERQIEHFPVKGEISVDRNLSF